MKTKPLKRYEDAYTIREDGYLERVNRTHKTRNKFGEMDRTFKGGILKQHVSSRGYMMSELNYNKKIKTVLIHRLVYENFVGELIKGMVIHHKDGNKLNNHFTNLEQLDYFQHTNIHSHEPWNKGMKMSSQHLEKCLQSRNKRYLSICLQTSVLRNSGIKIKHISEMLNISSRQVSARIKYYKEFNNVND